MDEEKTKNSFSSSTFITVPSSLPKLLVVNTVEECLFSPMTWKMGKLRLVAVDKGGTDEGHEIVNRRHRRISSMRSSTSIDTNHIVAILLGRMDLTLTQAAAE